MGIFSNDGPVGRISSRECDAERERLTQRVRELEAERESLMGRISAHRAEERREPSRELMERNVSLIRQNHDVLAENGTLRVELDAALKRAADMTDLACRAQDRVQQLLMERIDHA